MGRFMCYPKVSRTATISCPHDHLKGDRYRTALGLTLIEVIIALGVMSLFVGASYYAGCRWLDDYYIDVSVKYAQRMFEYIQTLQRTEHATVILCHSEHGARCDAVRSAQYLLLAGQAQPYSLESAIEKKLRFFPCIHPSVTVVWQFFTSKNPNGISYFYPTPQYQNNGSLVFCRNRLPKKALIINSLSRMRVSLYANWSKEAPVLRQHLYALAQQC